MRLKSERRMVWYIAENSESPPQACAFARFLLVCQRSCRHLRDLGTVFVHSVLPLAILLPFQWRQMHAEWYSFETGCFPMLERTRFFLHLRNRIPNRVEILTLGASLDRATQQPRISRLTRKNIDLTVSLCRFMREAAPFRFTSVEVKKNYAAPRHRTVNSSGDSRYISLGDFTGGELVIDEGGNLRREATYRCVTINEAHWRWVDTFEGTSHGLSFFTIRHSDRMTE